MVKNTAKKAQIEARQFQVSELFLKGHRHATDIARCLGGKWTSMTIGRDLAVCRRRWRESVAPNMAEILNEELRKIDRLEEEAWAAWERSCADRRKTRAAKKTEGGKRVNGNVEVVGGKETTTKEVATEETVGDPRFMEQIRWCISERCKLLGVTAPQQIEHTVRTRFPDVAGVDRIEDQESRVDQLLVALRTRTGARRVDRLPGGVGTGDGGIVLPALGAVSQAVAEATDVPGPGLP